MVRQIWLYREVSGKFSRSFKEENPIVERNTEIDKTLRYVIMAGSVIMLLSVILIEVWAAYYTVFDADDFSIANSMRPYGDSVWEYVYACFQYIKRMYVNWQGTYSSMFIQTIIHPLNGLGLTQLRVVMVLNFFLYFFSLIFFILIVFNIFLENNYHIKLFFCACVVFMIINSRAYPEVFFWYCGAAAYSFPVICLLISLGLFIISNTNNKRRILYVVLASFFSVGSQGGSLAITGTGCYLILVLCFGFWLHSKKISVTNIVVSLIYMAGAVVNVIAPGNFVRHSNFEEGIHPITAIDQTIKHYFLEMKTIIKNDQFCVIFLLLILCGAILCVKLQSDIKIYTLISLLLLITPVVSIFPVILGYGENAVLPNRVLFVVNTGIVLVYSNLVVVVGYWITTFVKKIGMHFIWPKCALAVLLLFFLFRVFFVSDIRNTVMIRTLKDLYHGNIQEYYAECREVYEYLAESSEADIFIEDFPQRVENFGSFQLYADPDEWVNTCVANYYHKNSVRTID